MAREFQTFLKLFRRLRPLAAVAAPESRSEPGGELNDKDTPEHNPSRVYGLPIGRRVRVILRGAPNPELVGVLEIDEQLILLPLPSKDRNLALRIGEATFQLQDIESCCLI